MPVAGSPGLRCPLPPPARELSLHFPQTLALPLDSLLIPFPRCPVLGPTTPLTNIFPHFSSRSEAQAPHPPPLPKGGPWELTPFPSLCSFLSPSSPFLSYSLTFHPSQERVWKSLDKHRAAIIP